MKWTPPGIVRRFGLVLRGNDLVHVIGLFAMQKWEYIFYRPQGSQFDVIEDIIRQHGEEGWELVQLVYTWGNDDVRLVVFKRAVPNHP